MSKLVTRESANSPGTIQAGWKDADNAWELARELLSKSQPARGLNIAYECTERHVYAGRGDNIALRHLSTRDGVEEISFDQLQLKSNQFASVLQSLGIGKGDTVFSLLPRVPALYYVVLGSLKNTSVFCPLFSSFGPAPVRARLAIGEARVLVTTEQLYRRKVESIRSAIPSLEHVLLIDQLESSYEHEDTADFYELLDSEPSDFEVPITSSEDAALLHFTSGTTGAPKGVLHVHEAAVAHLATAISALDLRSDDVYWCTADPGWVTGTSYGVIAPLLVGSTLLIDEENFDAQRWYQILQDHQVSNWYTSPTAVRMLMKAQLDEQASFDLSKLRFIASVGEPLNPEAVAWSERHLGQPIHDNWWQTETGAIMIANRQGQTIRPGSMGKPLPGVQAAIVRPSTSRAELSILGDNSEGELALRRGWPSMFRTYLGQPERYASCFDGEWYLSGDIARRDADGYYWFVGRADDVIKSAGHLISPFEVESVLMEHPAVAEAAVIGLPDAMAKEVVKAFVVIKPPFEADESALRQLLAHCRKRLGTALAPRNIEFKLDLPKTRSGKIMRRLLKSRELGLPDGDISTLEKAYENDQEAQHE